MDSFLDTEAFFSMHRFFKFNGLAAKLFFFFFRIFSDLDFYLLISKEVCNLL